MISAEKKGGGAVRAEEIGFYLAFLHEDAPTALSPVAEAAERTSRVEGYRFDMSAQVTMPATGGIEMRGSGAYNGSTDPFSMWLEATGNFPGSPTARA